MSDSKSAGGGGVGCCTVLFLIFLVLKLTDNIDWSWWWVFSPFWIPLALVAVIVACVLVVAGFIAAIKIFK